MSTYDTIMAQQLKQRMDRASQAPPLNAPSLYPTQQNPLTTPPQLNVQQAATGGVQQQPKPQSQPAQQQPQMSYADMFVQLNPYRQPTPEDLEAERKRYRRNAVFAAISDGLSALSNLYFTTKGAPNAYTGGSTLTGKMYERQKQLMQERQANQEKWLNGYLRAMEMDRNTANQERNWQHQLQREALTDQRYNDEWNRNETRYQQQQADAQATREQTQKNWQTAHDETVRHNKANESISYTRAIKPTGGSGEDVYKLGDYTVTVPANKLKNYQSFLNSIGESYGISWDKGKKQRKTLKEFEQEVMANPDARQYIIDWAKSNDGEVKENKKTTTGGSLLPGNDNSSTSLLP